jgi:hypothetical protein
LAEAGAIWLGVGSIRGPQHAAAAGRGVSVACATAPKMSRHTTFPYCLDLNVEQVALDGFYRIAEAMLFAAHKATDGRFHGRH